MMSQVSMMGAPFLPTSRISREVPLAAQARVLGPRDAPKLHLARSAQSDVGERERPVFEMFECGACVKERVDLGKSEID